MAGYAPDNTTLAATGFVGVAGMTFQEQFMTAGMIILSGGALLTASKFGPRVAFEPRYDFARGKQRMQLTLNGRPLRRRNNRM